METNVPPITPRLWERTMTLGQEPVLALSVRRPAFPEKGAFRRVERYFSRCSLLLREQWETVLYPRACQARRDDELFLPWRAALDYAVTYWESPLLSLRLEITHSDQLHRPRRWYVGETWDCAQGRPRLLSSFFPGNRRWRRQLTAQLVEQARQRVNSGETLLRPDCPETVRREFDPERFYLTGEGLALFYPMYLLGPYAEGVPVFTVPLSPTETAPPPGQAPPGGGSAPGWGSRRGTPAPAPP